MTGLRKASLHHQDQCNMPEWGRASEVDEAIHRRSISRRTRAGKMAVANLGSECNSLRDGHKGLPVFFKRRVVLIESLRRDAFHPVKTLPGRWP